MTRTFDHSRFGRRLGVVIATTGLLVLGLFVGASFQGSAGSAGPRIPAVDPATSCGPVSLGLVSHWLGTPRTIDELTRLAHAEDTGTSSLLDLRQAADSIGLAAEGVRLNPSSPFPGNYR